MLQIQHLTHDKRKLVDRRCWLIMKNIPGTEIQTNYPLLLALMFHSPLNLIRVGPLIGSHCSGWTLQTLQRSQGWTLIYQVTERSQCRLRLRIEQLGVWELAPSEAASLGQIRVFFSTQELTLWFFEKIVYASQQPILIWTNLAYCGNLNLCRAPCWIEKEAARRAK